MFYHSEQVVCETLCTVWQVHTWYWNTCRAECNILKVHFTVALHFISPSSPFFPLFLLYSSPGPPSAPPPPAPSLPPPPLFILSCLFHVTWLTFLWSLWRFTQSWPNLLNVFNSCWNHFSVVMNNSNKLEWTCEWNQLRFIKKSFVS